MSLQRSPALSAVLADLEAGAFTDSKREHVRHEASSLILYVAKIREPGEKPFLRNFFPVRCRDLSSGGLSFFMPAKPSFQRLVVQLGDPQSGIYMESEVMHVSPARELPPESSAWDGTGKKMEIELGMNSFLVGCQFLRRLPAAPR